MYEFSGIDLFKDLTSTINEATTAISSGSIDATKKIIEAKKILEQTKQNLQNKQLNQEDWKKLENFEMRFQNLLNMIDITPKKTKTIPIDLLYFLGIFGLISSTIILIVLKKKLTRND